MEVIGERGKRHFVYANLLICQEMNTTLARTDLNHDFKATLYNQKLQQFLAMKQQQQDQYLPPLPKTFPSTHESEPELPYVDLSIPETDKEQEAQEKEEEIAPSTYVNVSFSNSNYDKF